MNGHPNVLEIKIITTRVSDASGSKESRDEITFVGSALLVPCAGHSWLEVSLSLLHVHTSHLNLCLVNHYLMILLLLTLPDTGAPASRKEGNERS